MQPTSLSLFASNINHLEFIGNDVTVCDVKTDSRQITPNDLFIAIKGEKFDGHNYIEQAIANGASAIISQQAIKTNIAQIIVKDTVIALGEIAKFWQSRFDVLKFAITGSNGKTTIKEMLSAILATRGKVLKPKGSYNNHIGLPLTLLKLDDTYSYAVLEMGANHVGEIAYLVNIAEPDVRAVSIVAPAHLEGFGSIENIYQAKKDIYNGLTDFSKAIYPNNNKFTNDFKKLLGEKAISFGETGDVFYSDIKANNFNLNYKNKKINITLNFLGKHNIYNATCAGAMALSVGFSLEEIKAGLLAARPADRRLNLLTLENDIKIIDDSYNANPESVKAAINVIAEFPGDKIFAFGQMGELGQDGKKYHQEVGKLAKSAEIKYLFAYGDLAQHAVESFGKNAYFFANQQELINNLRKVISPGAVLLVKGSNSMHMDKIVESFR